MSSIHDINKDVVAKLRHALYDLNPDTILSVMDEVFSPHAAIHLTHPFGDLTGPKELFETAYQPLIHAVPDLERRDFIVMAGPSNTEGDWVGCGGHYVGVFEQPWLDIPPTCHPVAMRFHEFFRVEGGRITEMQAIWDIPQLMMQARAWPMSPSLGVEWMIPAPATQDGLSLSPRDDNRAEASQKLVLDMLNGLSKHADHGPEAMTLDAFWHPKMTWYGPAGIGTNRRISGFRNWHQIPFLKAMPDRGSASDNCHHFFADGDYVAVTGWPNMRMTISGDGWLGIAPAGQPLTMRSLDFWRCENGLIRENWVLVDILHVYHLLNVDVFERMREFTIDRQAVRPPL